jgi:Zn-dependent protease
VLYALDDPLSLLVLVLAFVVASTLAGWVATLAAGRAVAEPGRRRPDPRRHVDPFGAVAAALTGVGWARPVTLPKRRPALVALAGPAVLLVVGAACLAGVGVLVGGVDAGPAVLQSGVQGLPLGPRVLLLTGLVHLYVGLLSLVPLPPLDGGRLLFALAPRTLGWQRAQDYLVERNLGTAAVLVLLFLPLGGRLPLLLAVLSAVGRPLVRLASGLA